LASRFTVAAIFIVRGILAKKIKPSLLDPETQLAQSLDTNIGFIMRHHNLAAAIALVAFVATGFQSQANSPRVKAEDRVFAYDAQLPACDDMGVLGTIQSRFKEREPTYWNSSLGVTQIDRVKTTAFRPNGQDLIPRRYCAGRALLSNGKYHTVEYNIVEDSGFSGWHGSLFLGLVRFPTPGSYSVEWCISGLDRHRTYAQNCRMARP
jgi:hypothetical protein